MYRDIMSAYRKFTGTARRTVRGRLEKNVAGRSWNTCGLQYLSWSIYLALARDELLLRQLSVCGFDGNRMRI